ncbi:hypothetical protein B0T19DRAFT_439053 [Cercophora scortea]|uniref:non-specific serine/threonine protein kinase n=1 Tax=Cercophora scortea TaxID=314031 RepID=A0AAE0MHA8_9PEZI|nr:hypothetical protein B0T19DRAFT_439053 [Cercophora scortea]
MKCPLSDPRQRIREAKGSQDPPYILPGLLSSGLPVHLEVAFLRLIPILPASRLLRSSGSGKNLFSDLSRLNSAINSDDFDLDNIKPLLRSAITGENNALIWKKVYSAVTEPTPPPQPIASSLQQTPWFHNTGSFANSSEYHKDVDRVLRDKLGVMYVGIPRFYETFFGRVADLGTASEAVFEKCKEGSEPLFSDGWSGWPEDANQDHVLSWFSELSEKLATFAEDYRSIPTHRRPLAQPNKPIQGSTAERKLDVGFVDDPKAGKDSRCHWSHILVPGELKSNPAADTAAKAWLDIGTYAREVLAVQDIRRFVLGFTICGSLMRVWEFDRLGGLASERFDINEDGSRFVFTVLGFLWMSEEELGFDPTFTAANGQRFIEIERNGSKERLIIDEMPLVIKDSWQYPERHEEGELLCEVTRKGVINMARHYHHETVQIHGANDDVRNNVRRGLDITRATNYRPERPALQPAMAASDVSQRGRGSSAMAGEKRSSSQTGASLPHSKRTCSASPVKAGGDLSNRVHRRVILRDYGKPIYKASSRTSLLAALSGCIEGHESLRKAGVLHRDISINNLLINEDTNNPSRPSFLIDLDLAIKEDRKGSSGARGKTGTRVFMAIGTLLGEQHSFMHDLESFFWVLFWICIHYTGPDKSRPVTEFDKWNYVDTEELAKLKLGTVTKESLFMKTMTDNFTPYYAPLIPLLNRLRKVVFPKDKPWEREDEKLYSQMRGILQEGMDLN